LTCRNLFSERNKKKKTEKIYNAKSIELYLHLDVASNFSLFFFLRHFHGLKSLPSALNLLLRSCDGVRELGPKLFVLSVRPFCFLAANEKSKKKN
jgi:hypothetical protein